MNNALDIPSGESPADQTANDDQEAVDTNSQVEGRYERIKAAEAAHHALLARPRLSLHLQINLGFLLIFLFVLAISVTLVLNMYSVENRLQWLEIVNEYAVEMEQTRLFEKNYFLYGTNLNDAVENAFQTNALLDRNAEEISKLLGENGQADALQNIRRYEGLLQRLELLEKRETRDAEYKRAKNEIEPELRKYGHQLLSYGQDMMRREKK
ncbi:MAG: hypothetical protein P8X85_19445, partial [Desulfobacterales bacterium]